MITQANQTNGRRHDRLRRHRHDHAQLGPAGSERHDRPDRHRGPRGGDLTVARSSADGTPDFRIFTVDASVSGRPRGYDDHGWVGMSSGGGIANEGTMTVINSTICQQLGPR